MLNDVQRCWTKFDCHQTLVQQSCIKKCWMMWNSFDGDLRLAPSQSFFLGTKGHLVDSKTCAVLVRVGVQRHGSDECKTHVI